MPLSTASQKPAPTLGVQRLRDKADRLDHGAEYNVNETLSEGWSAADRVYNNRLITRVRYLRAAADALEVRAVPA